VVDVAIANELDLLLEERRLKQAVRMVFADAGVDSGEVSIAVVGDSRIHELNREYLGHDYPTDVLSFVLEREPERLDGQIVVSADYAAREAPNYGWRPQDELLLYVIHGALHLVGYDDLTPDKKRQMRAKEREYLARFGLTGRYAEKEAD
jgi:probable rRNA maturation factor